MLNKKRLDQLKIHNRKFPTIKTLNAKALNENMKVFLNSNDLIKEMEDKITFSSEELMMVEKMFNSINYYRFSIYPKLLPKSPTTKPIYSFTDALKLYEFDGFLKKHLYEFTSFLEIKWKGSFISHLGQNYSNSKFHMAQCYLDLDLYSSRKWGIEIILNLQETIVKSNSLSIKHHLKNRNGYVPIWALIEELTLGQFETFFTQTDEYLRRTYVKNYYKDSYFKRVNGWISVIRELRNKISHHSRLYGANFTKSPGFLKADKRTYFQNANNQQLDIKKNQLVASFYVINKFLLFEEQPIQQQWNHFLDLLKIEIDSISEILDLDKHIGFDDNWLNVYKIIIP